MRGCLTHRHSSKSWWPGGPCVARLTPRRGNGAQGVGAALGFLVAWLTQTHVLHVATGGLEGGVGEGSEAAPKLPGTLRGFCHLASPPSASLSLCVTPVRRWAEAGEGARSRQVDPGAGADHTVVQVLLAASASPATHAHTVESKQLSSGRCPHFCSEGDPEPHIRPHLRSNPSL